MIGKWTVIELPLKPLNQLSSKMYTFLIEMENILLLSLTNLTPLRDIKQKKLFFPRTKILLFFRSSKITWYLMLHWPIKINVSRISLSLKFESEDLQLVEMNLTKKSFPLKLHIRKYVQADFTKNVKKRKYISNRRV